MTGVYAATTAPLLNTNRSNNSPPVKSGVSEHVITISNAQTTPRSDGWCSWTKVALAVSGTLLLAGAGVFSGLRNSSTGLATGGPHTGPRLPPEGSTSTTQAWESVSSTAAGSALYPGESADMEIVDAIVGSYFNPAGPATHEMRELLQKFNSRLDKISDPRKANQPRFADPTKSSWFLDRAEQILEKHGAFTEYPELNGAAKVRERRSADSGSNRRKVVEEAVARCVQLPGVIAPYNNGDRSQFRTMLKACVGFVLSPPEPDPVHVFQRFG